MGCCQSLQASPNSKLRRHKEICAQLIATAQKLGNSTWDLHNPIQSIRESSHDTQIPFHYMGFRGQYHTHRCINNCVLDSLLAGCHIAAKVYLNIKELFEQDSTIRAVMTLLNSRKYAEAKALWLITLDLREGRIKHFRESESTDVRGHVTDYLINFSDLTGTSFHYEDDRRSPNLEDHMYSKTVSKFEEFGDVRALGPKSNPQLILVHVAGRMDGLPALIITDDYGREFKLQFLLLGITANTDHTVLCTSLDGAWWLYDDTKTPLFKEVQMEDITTQGYVVSLAAYVNVPAKNGSETERCPFFSMTFPPLLQAEGGEQGQRHDSFIHNRE
ncbi:hypothetical protein ANANG_G00116270 [Anguilla anguilla]|uniref:Uncharacterized protein n=1 Tax=Anguilla anguilla TaxID=7936 RepID=A0A9D3MFG9_ANGAN|nr:hypothetical protein ANANG_G00116270 [Anguilla anguilla]